MASPDPSAEVLRRTSRTFALSIQLLPRRMRAPVRSAYLLARIADTIADTGTAPVSARSDLLARFRAAVAGRGEAPDLGRAPGATSGDPTERAEAALLAGAARWLDEAARLPAADRAEVRDVVDILIATMEAELRLVGSADAGGVASLDDGEALVDYADGIAGCVGVFWTRLVARHAARVEAGAIPALEIAARRYGRALQYVNVLRDAGADLARGLCLLPADEIAAAGFSPGGLVEAVREPSARRDARRKLRPLLARWSRRAHRGLLGGLAYTTRLRRAGPRVRMATSLPAALGLATLARLADDPRWLDPGAKISIGRSGLRRVTARTALASATRRGPLRLGRLGRGNRAARRA